jgi:hypothetical protein
MNDAHPAGVESFAVAARGFCAWATSPVVKGEHSVGLAAQHVSALLAAGFKLGPEEGEPADLPRPEPEMEAVRLKASALPFRYYSEVFNNLVIPPEEPVVGDIVDDLVDIYSEIAPGLTLFENGDIAAAKNHWQFWLSNHWGEHATSALRALWSYVAKREGSSL